MKKLISVFLAILMAFGVFAVAASALSGNVPKDIAQATKQIAVEIEEEGLVLLKNEDNALPLGNKKVNVFGSGSITPFLGGAGSGAITTNDPITLYEAFDEAGISYNKELKKTYESFCLRNETPKTDNTVINNLLQLVLAKSSLEEMPTKKLTSKIMNNAKAFSDTAVIVISRTSAETSDLSEDVLKLGKEEKALVEKVCKAFGEVIILFNTGNIMEMGWLNEYESIKAAAMLWIPGEFGLLGAANVLSGKASPSGRLADTVAYKVSSHPSGICFGDHKFDGADQYYVEYLEGIYTGYRYFETFAPDEVMYPFGYGLSYTSFEKSNASISLDGDTINASVTVTNTGSVSGKETVQLYYSAPYIPGGIEKSVINLGSFAKTKLLAPGESQRIELSIKLSDMASYDMYNEQAWVLDEGTYTICLSNNIRDHFEKFDFNIDSKIVYKTDSKTGAEIKNLFADAFDGKVLSRADSGVLPEYRQLKADDGVKNPDKLPAPTNEGTAPVTGAKYDKTIKLEDVAKDESLWDKFLDQLTIDEMAELVCGGGYETKAIDRLGIPLTMDNDGPSCVKGRQGQLYTDCGTAYPCETCMACSWNTELAKQYGEGIGKEANAIGTDVWYAPAVTLHRNPMAGRNFEYFSEDPIISARMATAIIKGANEYDLVTTIKHFALNEQETHRNGIFTYANEQTLRELYFKAFEQPIKEAEPWGVMSAYNRIGTKWCGGNSALLNDLLRNEWGFKGYVVSDYSSNLNGKGYMSPALAVYNGNDTMLTGLWGLQKSSHYKAIRDAYKKDPVGFGNALRTSVKNLCVGKMHTKAFLDQETKFDDSFLGSMTKPSEWNFKFPYLFSAVKYVFNNIANTVIYFIRFIM